MNFDTLSTESMNPCDFDDLLAKVKEALNRGKRFESRASELYIDLMRVKLRHFVLVRETGLVIQTSLFGLPSSQDGLVAYQTSDKKLLLKIKCPHTKKLMSPIDFVQDPVFYVHLENGKPVLKNHILLAINHKFS